MSAEEAKKKGGCLKKIGIAFLVLVLIGAIGAVTGGSDDSSSTDEPTPSVQQSEGVDKSLLESIANTARGNDGSEFTEDSYAALTAAIEAADAVLADESATQEQVDAAREAVTDAVSALVEKDPLTMGEQNAVAKANSYLSIMHFSRAGLIEQLEFEGFTTEEATFAVDYIEVDWNEQAAGKAQDYIDTMSFSRTGLIEQLEFEGFTKEQAEYGVTAIGY